MTNKEKAEYIKNKCEHCPWSTDYNQCVHFDFDDLKVAVEKCMTREKK